MMTPEHTVYAAVCDDPDAEELVWHPETAIGHDIMLNKPIVTSSGKWLFPIAVWDEKMQMVNGKTKTKESGAFLYESVDEGKSFRRLGSPRLTARSFDEHMAVELSDGRLMMLTRTHYGISQTFSRDGGMTWSEEQPFPLGGPDSRFHIRRLKTAAFLSSMTGSAGHLPEVTTRQEHRHGRSSWRESRRRTSCVENSRTAQAG